MFKNAIFFCIEALFNKRQTHGKFNQKMNNIQKLKWLSMNGSWSFYLHLCIMRNDSQCGFKVCNRIYLCKINTKLYSYCRCQSHSFY
jgi:hypothetical protein